MKLTGKLALCLASALMLTATTAWSQVPAPKNGSTHVIVPEPEDRGLVHDVIYDELCRGVIRDASRDHYRRIMDDLVARGAEAIILGCTEIGLLVAAQDARVPLFDTTALHAGAAVEAALAE